MSETLGRLRGGHWRLLEVHGGPRRPLEAALGVSRTHLTLAEVIDRAKALKTFPWLFATERAEMSNYGVWMHSAMDDLQ